MIYKNGIVKGTELNESYANFTVQGSLNIEDNIVSGFSKSNYITIPNMSFGSSTWDVYFSVKTASDINTNQGILSFSSGYTFGFVVAEGDCLISLGEGGSSFSIGEKRVAITANTSYDFKISFDGTAYTLSILENGIYVIKGTINSSTKLPLNLGTMRVGLHRHGNSFFLGTFDLSKFSIVVGEKTIYSPAVNKASISDYQITANEFYEI